MSVKGCVELYYVVFSAQEGIQSISRLLYNTLNDHVILQLEVMKVHIIGHPSRTVFVILNGLLLMQMFSPESFICHLKAFLPDTAVCECGSINLFCTKLHG